MSDQPSSPASADGASQQHPPEPVPSRSLERLLTTVDHTAERALAGRRAAGKDIINLSSVEPELPPPEAVVKQLCTAAAAPSTPRGAGGLAEFRDAIARWYQSRFKTSVDPGREVLPLPSVEEGILGLAQVLLDPDDVALVPDPARRVYRAALSLVGARVVELPLRPEQDFLPELKTLSEEVAAAARVLWLDYPNDPTGAVAPAGFFHQAVQFARERGILIVHVANYSEYTYDGYRSISLLEIPNARQVAVELHSMAHTLNLSGWPVAFAAGNTEALRLLRSYRQYLHGLTFVPAQRAVADTLLQVSAEWLSQRNALYQARRDKAIAALEDLGLHVRRPKAVPAVWAGVPAGYSSMELAELLLDETGVWLAPGSLYGSRGEGYVRMALTANEGRFQEALQRLQKIAVPPRGVPSAPETEEEPEGPAAESVTGEERQDAG